jgi:glutamate-5-semialdehyde dehydrogenase
VVNNSKSPVIVSGRGNNFLYIDSEADFEMALNIALDGKQRLSVCNALDKILIHESLPGLAVKTNQLIGALGEKDIKVFGDNPVCELQNSALPVPDEGIWYEEFLAAKIVVGIVKSVSEAIEKINKYSGGHSAAIVTETRKPLNDSWVRLTVPRFTIMLQLDLPTEANSAWARRSPFLHKSCIFEGRSARNIL